MEEKWWSKFQTKNDGQSVSVDNQEVVVEPTVEATDSFFKENSSNEIFEDAINFIQDLNVKIDKSVDEAVEKDTISKWLNEIDDITRDVADTIVDKGSEFINSKEVQDAALKAKEVMSDVVNEVKSWSSDVNVENKQSIFEDNNEFKKDIDAIKNVVNESMSRKEVAESIEFVKAKAEEANSAFNTYLNKPEVVNAKEYLNEKLDDTKAWVNVQLSRDEVADKVNYMKEKTEDAKKWVFDVYNSENVQNGIEKAKETFEDVAHSTKETFVKTVNDPKVQNSYVNAKETTVRTAKNISESVKKGAYEFKTDETLLNSLDEWKESAVVFTKQSAKLVGAAASELAHNEQVKGAALKGKELIIKGAHGVLNALNDWASKKKNHTESIKYLENEEDNN